MNVDRAKLKELAEKATPGPWYALDYFDRECLLQTSPDITNYHSRLINNGDFASSPATLDKEDADFIAAFNPQTALALLSSLEAAEAKLQALRELPRYMAVDTDNSCGDPDCCGGPWPNITLERYEPGKHIEQEDDELALKLSDVLAILGDTQPGKAG